MYIKYTGLKFLCIFMNNKNMCKYIQFLLLFTKGALGAHILASKYHFTIKRIKAQGNN